MPLSSLSANNGRGHWGSRLGFILAAAGSAIGLGNIWKFPYVTGENGGGLFVLIYIACVLVVGLPIMMAEIIIGRATQRSPVGAFGALSSGRSPWVAIGWLGVVSGFVILSYYSVVAGWALHFAWLSATGSIGGRPVPELEQLFGTLDASAGLNVFWHVGFMVLTVTVVLGGVQKGIERWARILMPTMFIMMLFLVGRAVTLPGFGKGIDFVLGFQAEKISAPGILEAMGQAFFTLSLGMGAILTYGSYFDRDGDVVGASVAIGGLDTLMALLASIMLFPITFSYGMEPAGGPGLVFKNIPIALAQLPGAGLLSTLFFVLLVFAALSSAVSLLEVAASYCIDERGWSRRKAVWVTGLAVTVLGLPSALSGSTHLFGARWTQIFGMTFFDLFDYLASNWFLPMGGLGIAVFVAWRLPASVTREEFLRGCRWPWLYPGWVILLRFVVPIAVVAVFLHAVGLV